MKLLVRAIPFVVLLAGLPAGAADAPKPQSPAEVEQMVRDAMALPPGTRITWQDEQGAALPLEKFAQSVAAGKGFSVSKDPKAGTATVRLQEMKPEAPIVDLPTQLPPLDLQDL